MAEPLEYEQEIHTLKDDKVLAKQNLKGDWINILLLLLLYTMQGFPFGLSSAVSIILQSKQSTTYNDQVYRYI